MKKIVKDSFGNSAAFTVISNFSNYLSNIFVMLLTAPTITGTTNSHIPNLIDFKS